MIQSIFNLSRPVLISTLAVLGYFQDIIFTSDVSNYFFLGIIAASLILGANDIIKGYKDIYNAIAKK